VDTSNSVMVRGPCGLFDVYAFLIGDLFFMDSYKLSERAPAFLDDEPS